MAVYTYVHCWHGDLLFYMQFLLFSPIHMEIEKTARCKKKRERKKEKIAGNRSIRSQGSFDMLDRINAVVTQRRRKKESKLFET